MATGTPARTVAGGTALGLAIAKQIVEMHVGQQAYATLSRNQQTRPRLPQNGSEEGKEAPPTAYRLQGLSWRDRGGRIP
jgi:signal transduction histidine kinase